MKRLPIELIEHVLILTVRKESWGFNPLPYLRVAPGMTKLRRVVFNLNFTPSFNAAALAANLPLLKEYVKYRDPKNKFFVDTSALCDVCRKGRVDVLEWWLSSGIPFPKCSLYFETEHVAVLDFWRRSGLDLEYDEGSVDTAAERGWIHVLEWWRTSGLEFKYSHSAIDYAVANQRMDVLEWFASHRMELKHNMAFYYASNWGRVHILDWFKAHGVVMDPAKIEGELRSIKAVALDWWRRECPEWFDGLPWGVMIVDATSDDDPSRLQWIADSLVPVDDPRWCTTPSLLDVTCERGEVSVLDWLAANLPPAALTYTEIAIDNVSPWRTKLPVLEWMHRTGRELKYTDAALECFSMYGRVECLQWLMNHGYEIKYKPGIGSRAIMRGQKKVAEWWRSTGLPNCFLADEQIKYGSESTWMWAQDTGFDVGYALSG
ncbi:hypothetical protein H9P43_002655 [Blastocladiella emersonii ATCC 22665]|nr:hypothetical protein H9P43_002655 [Blastocladiella emersonii ATCC 22665]